MDLSGVYCDRVAGWVAVKFLMNFKQLKCFHAVAREGSFRAAADALSITQPNVTTHIKALENFYGVELFCRREGQPVALTDTGRQLLAKTQQIFGLETESDELLRSVSGMKTGTLRIFAASPYQVTAQIIEFGRRYPGVSVSVSIGNSYDALVELRDFRCDVAILALEDNSLRVCSIPYWSDHLIVVVDRDHPWSKRRNIKFHELQDQRVVLREIGSMTRKAFEDALRKSQINVRRVLEIGSHEAVREAVAGGIGIGIILGREFVPDERLKPINISDKEIRIQMDAVCLPERRNAPTIEAYFDVVTDTCDLK